MMHSSLNAKLPHNSLWGAHIQTAKGLSQGQNSQGEWKMKTNIGDARQIRNESLAGIAVMLEDVERAEVLLADIDGDAVLSVFEGNRFKTYAALSKEALPGLADFQAALENANLRHCLALSVPTKELQSEPTIEDGVAQRTFCSANGLPYRTQQEQQDGTEGSGYKYRFTRPSFWLVRLIVDTDGKPVFYSTLLGQYRNSDGQLEYRPVTKKSFEDGAEVEKPITKIAISQEEAVRDFHSDAKFIFAMCKSVTTLAESQRRRSGLIASVNRAPVERLTNTLGELFPGLANIKVAKPKKSKKVSKAKEEVATE